MADDRRRLTRLLLTLARAGGVRPWHYALPVGLMVVAAALEGAAMALLVPLAQGLASDSFTAIWQLRGFRAFQAAFPAATAIVSASSARTFLFIVVAIFCASVLGVAVGAAAARICAWRNGIYAARIRSHTFARCLSFGKLYFDRTSPATVYEAIAGSEGLLTVLTALETAVDSAIRLLTQVAVMIAISWPMTIFLAVAFPVLRAVDRAIVRRNLRVTTEAAAAQHRFAEQAFAVISSMPLVKAFALEARTTRRYDDLVERGRALALERDNTVLLAAPLQQVVTLTALLLAVAVAVSLTRTDRTVELSVMCAFLVVARRLLPIVGFATDLRVRLNHARPLLERLADVFDDRDKYFIASGPREFHGLRHGIELRALSFAYAEGVTVLRQLSFTMAAGRTTALVGETGCGKTTVAGVIARLYECQPGTVLFDGVDVREFSRESLARHVAYVGQDAWLFRDTLRANLVIGLDRSAGDDELWDMLDRVGLADALRRLPAGLDTEVGDRGVTLSGGEKQRLCIARALLRRAALVILDEATSALDSQTERVVLSAVERATRGATVLTIAHRLSTIQSADHVIVLERGGLAEEGSWTQLVAAGGRLAAMWTLQSRAVVDGVALAD